MQMINVLQRLAELDAGNPNVVYDKKQGVAEGYSTLDLWNMSPKEVIELLDANKITYDDFRAYQDLVIQGGPDADDDFDYTDHSMRKGEQGVAEGHPIFDPILQKTGAVRSRDNITGLSTARDQEQGKERIKTLSKQSTEKMKREKKPALPEKDMSEGTEQSVEECGMVGGMDRPSTPASINMTAATGEELGHMLKDIMSLAGVSKSEAEPLSTTPSIGLASRDGMDMKSMIDKLNDMETVETIDSMPNDPIPTEPFDAEQHAHHENPPGADRKGNANNPRAYDTNESAVERLMAEYKKFIGEDSK